MNTQELTDVYRKALYENDVESFKKIRELSKEDNRCLELLGSCYFHGAGTDESVIKGVDAFYEAYSKGYVDALYSFKYLFRIRDFSNIDKYAIRNRLKDHYGDRYSLTMLGFIDFEEDVDPEIVLKEVEQAKTNEGYMIMYDIICGDVDSYYDENDMKGLFKDACDYKCYLGLGYLACLFHEVGNYKLEEDSLKFIEENCNDKDTLGRAYYMIGLLYKEEAYNDCYFKTALNYLKKSYNLGIKEASFSIGYIIFYYGKLQGYDNLSDAYKYLSIAYENIGIIKDKKDKRDLFKMLAFCYDNGMGCNINEDKANEFKGYYRELIDNYVYLKED